MKQVETDFDFNGTKVKTKNEIPTAVSELAGYSSLEQNSNKVTSISSASTDVQYPSAKAVYDLVDTALGDIETLLAEI